MSRRGHRIGWMTGVVACVTLVCQGALAQAAKERIGITDVAPPRAFLVASVPDWTAAKAAMNRSELGKLWAEPEVRSFLKSMFEEELSAEEGEGGVWGWLAENVDAEDLREPVGAVGMAMFPAKVPDPDDAAKEIDQVQTLLIADFGDEADAFMETIEEVLSRLEREGHIELDEDEFDGVEIRIVTIVQEEEAAAEEGEDPMDPFGGGPDRSFDAFNTMMLAVSEGRMVATTNRAALEGALDRIAGRRVESIGENPTYRSAAAQHPADQHAMVIALANEFVRTSVRGGFDDMMGMAPVPIAPAAIIESLGVGAVEAAGLGIRFDTDAGSLEQSIALLAPQKKGLLSLVDSSIGEFQPPAFVPADAMGLWSVGLRFDRVADLVRGVIRAMPPEFQEQALAGFDQVAAPILASLGNELHVVQSLTRPLGPESNGSFVAIRLKDPLALANSLNGFAPMLGMEPRAFEGNQLFEGMEEGQPSIGIGFDHVFIGPAVAIENAMRLAARPETPRLAGAARFTRASEPLDGGAAMYNYGNMDESLAWTYWSMENAEKAFIAQIEEWGADPEMREEFLADFRENQPKWQQNLPPMKVILEHVGDTVTELRSTPDGFRGRSVLLRPAGR